MGGFEVFVVAFIRRSQGWTEPFRTSRAARPFSRQNSNPRLDFPFRRKKGKVLFYPRLVSLEKTSSFPLQFERFMHHYWSFQLTDVTFGDSFSQFNISFLERAFLAKLSCSSFLTDEVELEQSCQEGQLVWSVKMGRVRLTRCVFRYGPRDGMTYSAIKPID